MVFNGNYFNYFDVAVYESWRAMVAAGTIVHGPALKQQFESWIHNIYVVKASADYLAPAHWDDVLDIGVRAARLGRSSMRTVLEIYRSDQHLISGELIYVYKDPAIAIRSGAMPSCSQACSVPVRPMPHITSSRISRMPWRSQISRTRLK